MLHDLTYMRNLKNTELRETERRMVVDRVWGWGWGKWGEAGQEALISDKGD